MIDSNRLRGHLDGLVLAVLNESSAHGFEILKRIEARGNGELSMKEGSIYPALYRLEEKKLIFVNNSEKMYRVTGGKCSAAGQGRVVKRVGIPFL